MNKIQKYRDQFLMIKKCKNVKTKNIELRDLLNSMEEDFEIPAMNDEDFNKDNPVVIELYREIGDERVF